MSVKDYTYPHSRSFSERQISPGTESFKSGVLYDMPGSKIPVTGLRYGKNVIVRPDGVEGRPGTRRWCANTVFPTIQTSIVASKSGTTITVLAGYNFTSANIGDFFIAGGDTVWDVITAVASGPASSYLLTTTRSSTYSTSTSCKLRGDLYGEKWHKGLRVWIIHAGSKLYYASYAKTSFTEIPSRNGSILKSNTRFFEYNNYMIAFNAGGIFRIDISDTYPAYYKMNSKVPQTLPYISTAAGDTYKRKYTTAFSIILGSGNRDRTTDGCEVLHESGNNKATTNLLSDQILDYGETIQNNAIDSTNYVSMSIYPNTSTYHWQFYSMYGTLDYGTNGKDDSGAVNSSERFYWMEDVPVIKAFVLSVTPAGSSYKFTTTSGMNFANSDLAATIACTDGIGYVVSAYTNLRNVLCNTVPVSSDDYYGTIGATKTIKASQTGTTVTRSRGSTFETTDVGQMIHWSDGTYSLITAYIDANTVTVLESATKTNLAAGLGPTTRVWTDTYTDAVLRLRVGNLLIQRFFRELPNCNLGTVVPGWIPCAQSFKKDLYYCQMDEFHEPHVGYYALGSGQFDTLDDTIKDISSGKTYFIVYCSDSRKKYPIDVYAEVSDQTSTSVGEAVRILTSRDDLPGKIGLAHFGSVQKDEYDRDVFIGQDKGLYIYDGSKTSNNMLEDRIHSKFEALQSVFASGYIPRSNGGLLFWGTENAES